MIIIGLCGRSGSGKSTVAEIFSKIGALHIDADEVCHYVYTSDSACVKEICDNFGSDVAEDGKIVRPVLSRRAYGIEGGIKLLNSIAHKYILKEIEKRIQTAKEQNEGFVVLDAPLLFESGLDKRCDFLIAVVATKAIKISRLKKRDGESTTELEKRLSLQLSDDELKRRCHLSIVNNGTVKHLSKKVKLAFLYVQLKFGLVNRSIKGRFYVK